MKPSRVIITGGATNIGRAITEAFLADGCRVAVGQMDTRATAGLVDRFGDRVISLAVDVGEPARCRQFIDTAVLELGGVDVLVNNAAITGAGAISSLAALTPEFFDRMTRVNIGGALFCSQAAAPYMKATGGVIVNISSINALRPQRGATVYAASKAALSSVTQSLAKELASDRIRVVAVAPGDIRVNGSTAVTEEMARQGVVSDVVNQTPLGTGEPQDVAQTVVFLCSERAKFVTGVTWVVDGGLLA